MLPHTRHCESAKRRFIGFLRSPKNQLQRPRRRENCPKENLTLYVSADDGKTWRNEKVICKGSAAYSDLVIQADNQIGILYEKDNYTKIVYERLNLKE
jgi:hypothetical protein